MALAEDIIAPHNVPPFDNSGMDGYAVQAVDTVDATAGCPRLSDVAETIPPGHVADGRSWPRGRQDHDGRSYARRRGHGGAVGADGGDGRRRAHLRAGRSGARTSAAPARTCRAGTGCSQPAPFWARPRSGCWPAWAFPRCRCTAAAGGHHLHGQRAGGGGSAARARADPQLQQLLAAGSVPADGRRGPPCSASCPTTTRPPGA